MSAINIPWTIRIRVVRSGSALELFCRATHVLLLVGSFWQVAVTRGVANLGSARYGQGRSSLQHLQ